MAAIDMTYSNILSEFIVYKPMFYQIYEGWATEVSKTLYILMGFVWSAALYLFAITLGYFITTSYYRMSKMMKIIISIGVPALFFNILPLIDSMVNNGKVYRWFASLFISMSGLNNGYNPLICIIALLIGALIWAGLAFLLVRRAPVKE